MEEVGYQPGTHILELTSPVEEWMNEKDDMTDEWADGHAELCATYEETIM